MNPLLYLGPGLLVAATGVGAGDLATSAFAGNQLGLAILWAVVLGAFFKFVLNEGLARWQLATGKTYIEGVFGNFGPVLRYLFLAYLFVWSYFVGSALISACGVAAQALVPLDDPGDGKIFYGIVHSVLGLVLVWLGGFRLFEKVMKVCIVIMFFTVLSTALLVLDDMTSLSGFFKGLLLPAIPGEIEGAIPWTVALIGGVGGTVTILCYAYWLKAGMEPERQSLSAIRADLAIAYGLTAIFGISMVVIGANVELSGKGAQLIVKLGEAIGQKHGSVLELVFLVGAWGALFSSLLGVWQSIPYLFCDIIREGDPGPENQVTASFPYRLYLVLIATVPLLGLFYSFKTVQMWYSIAGALFLPCLAATMLILNNKVEMINSKMANKVASNVALVAILLFFLLAFQLHLQKVISW